MGRKKQLKQSAHDLVWMAHASAVSLYIPMMDKHQLIGNIEPERWDLILTIASVFIAVSQLNHENIKEIMKEEIRDIIGKSLVEKYPDGLRALDDCLKVYDQTYDTLVNENEYEEKYLSADSLGIWIVWNLYRRQELNADETKLIRIIGSAIIHTFNSWWK